MSSLLLSLCIFSPLIGVLCLLFIRKEEERFIQMAGIISTLIPLLCASAIAILYWFGTSLKAFSVKVDWIQFGRFPGLEKDYFSIHYELGIDGFSLVMLVLTSLLATLSGIAGLSIEKNMKGFYILLLLLEVGMLGVFAAENLLLFFIFFELTLPAMFLLIGKWGKFSSEKAAYHYLIYNGIGSAILLIAFSILFAKTGTTNIGELTNIIAEQASPFGEMGETLQFNLFLAIMIAFAIKLPVFPLHRWMVSVHTEAHPAVVMLHAGILLKIGAYGMVRFGVGLFPEQFQNVSICIAILGVVNLLYGAFLAFIQRDFRSVLAYSSISHMGIVLLGLAAFNTSGMMGALFQIISHGLIAALLFFLLSMIEKRFGTSHLDQLGGLAKEVPVLSGFLLAGSMAALGLPGMSGFISEFLAFLGLFEVQPIVAVIGALGIILTAVYMLRAVLQVTFGEKKWPKTEDVRGFEYVPILVLLACIVIIGTMPNILSTPLNETLQLIGGW
ncbi:NADH-quinone oxidoreductase subunit M [Bacillus manliponensis]|uniref:NADH-quinone oxidoreductase subunit M n=1 Tax=Bacillus manliponensis TaxID=574376 RepID=UPI00351463E6